ncbi:12385_t:CDS:2, partial [Racocetra fulgida]
TKSEPSKDPSNNDRPFITQKPDGFAISPDNDQDSDSKSNFGFTKEQTEKLKETQEKFLSLTDPNALKSNSHLNITIWADPENRVLTITDSGIGMTRQQLKENLGTIAKSGTSEFLSAVEDKKADMNLIGQFGVGFYSVFLVADKVIVTTKHNDDDQYIWESQAINDFTIAKDPRGNTLGRGTQIKLHLKDDAISFLEDASIRNLILRYSEFINFPIWLWTKRSETISLEDEPLEKRDSDDEKSDSEEPKIEDASDDDDKKSEPKTKTIEVPGWELMNTQKPIWARDPKNVSEIEYENFYMSFSKDNSEVDFKAIVYIPSKAPDNLFQKVQDFARNVKLFVKRVFITDEFLDFVPKYLAFIKAIIDADDIPLNVSRETLQHHRSLQLIKKRIVKKTLELIADLKNDDVKYTKFLKEFGTSLKVGAIEDNENRKKIAHLLKFPSSYKGSNWTTIDDYISRMKKGQDKMYFITGSSVEEVEKSPFIEGFVARGYEVLYMVEPIDEMLVQHMPGHGGKMFQNIAKGNINLGDKGEIESMAELKFKFIKLTEWMQTILADQVEKKNEFLKEFYAKQKKILEINPHHPLMLGLLDRVEKGQTDETTKELVQVLYESTLIRSGYDLKDNLKVLRKNLGIDLNAKPEIDIVPAEDAKKEEDLFNELDRDEPPVKPSTDADDDSTDPTKPSYNHDEL